MAADRSVQRVTAAVERRPPVATTTQRNAVAVAPSPARALQQRLGNHGAQLFAAQLKRGAECSSCATGRPCDVCGAPMRKATRDRAPVLSPVSVTGSGMPFPVSLAADFGARLGHPVDDVVIHTDGAAVAAARSGCACGGGCPRCKNTLPIQRKLAVSEPGDSYEQEADRIADQVLPNPAYPPVSATPPHIQRFSGQSNGQSHAVPARVDHALATPGRPLEPALREDMEQRFGHDFSRVRVHSGAAAEQSARDVNARAYTVGRDIVFGNSRFTPGTEEGRRLIAHELTHVVQQSGAHGMSVGEGNEKRGLSPISLILQRDVATAAPGTTRVPQIKGKPGAKLSSMEAVHQLELKFFAEDGLFSTLHHIVANFKDDMKTKLGWYVGEKKASSKKKTGLDVAAQAVTTTAKTKAKEAIIAGLKHVAVLLPAGGGPARMVAGVVGGVLWDQFSKIAEYDPVITEEAQKAPHQHYIEATEKTLSRANRTLQETLTANEDEMAAGSIDEIKSLIAIVDQAIKEAEKSFYLELVQGYRAVAPATTVELPTPHAKWTGEKRGLYGGGTYVTPITSGTIYVEFNARGDRPEDIRIVRTVIPELPSNVLASLNDADPSLTLGYLAAGTARIVMEAKTGGWEVRIVWEAGGKLVPADAPSYTMQYLISIARARGAREKTLEREAYNGAVFVWTKIINTPLREAKFDA